MNLFDHAHMGGAYQEHNCDLSSYIDLLYKSIVFKRINRAASSVMMRLASRPTPPTVRDALNTSAPYRVEPTAGGLSYLYHDNNNSLQRTLGQFREHHRVCAIRRRRAAVVEVQRETQRTDFLAKKYTETVRQEHSNTSLSIGLVTPGAHHPNPSSSSQQHHSTSSTLTTIPPMSLSSGCSIMSSSIDEGKVSPGLGIDMVRIHA